MSALGAQAASGHEKPVNTFLRFSLGILALGVIAASAVGIGVGVVQLAYGDVIYPGVQVWGADLGGATRAQAAEILSRQITYAQSPVVTLRDEANTWTITPGQLGVQFELDATVDAAFGYGRSGNLVDDLVAQWQAWYTGQNISPVLTFNPDLAAQYMDAITAEIDRPPVEATIEVEGLDVYVTPGEYGRTVLVPTTIAQLVSPFSQLEPVDVPLVIDEYRPEVLDATQQAEIARTILQAPLEIYIESPRAGDPEPWVFEPEALARMLAIRRVEQGLGEYTYAVGLDDVQLRGFLETLVEPLAAAPENARFIFNDDSRELEVIQPAIVGRQLNIDATVRAVNDQLVAGNHRAALQFDFTEPEIGDDATAAALGITGLVSAQTTTFYGSGETRISNIKVGGATMHGVLVPPWGEFSFNSFLGDVSLDTGFAEALIIFGGRTIKGVGGGICQVSTTAFRAAFYGGYPIVERNSHAYRVGYYEQGPTSPGPGLDATIFTPVADFRFTNDRDAWLLIEVYVSESNRSITYKFYSADDGRQVRVGAPVVQNTVEPEPPVYEQNPELETGEIKQVDWEAQGADVSVTRTVTRDGEVMFEDVVRTHYQPWQAVYQYGPGTELPEEAADGENA